MTSTARKITAETIPAFGPAASIQPVGDGVVVLMTDDGQLFTGNATTEAVLRRVVADGTARGEFRAIEPAHATGCIRTAMIRFMHPLLISQCECIPGPSAEEMIAFILSSLEARPERS